MIVEFAGEGGTSFKGLAAYLLHDPDKAKTSERVGWTHTLNLAQDHPSLAVDEMLWTYRAAADLKREAGLGSGGRKLEHSVQHFSLNWHPSKRPGKEHMINTVQDFLKRMNWHEHQALLVCHTDKPHAHVHVMVNVVHPETGRALNASYSWRRSEAWTLDYLRQHDRKLYEERLKAVSDRAPSPPRHVWLQGMALEEEYLRAEKRVERLRYSERNDGAKRKDKEWQALKGHQRDQRDAYYAGGKQAYKAARNAVYQEVQKEFKPQWREFYAAKRDGLDGDELKAKREAILKARDTMLDQRTRTAFDALRKERDGDREAMNKRHQEERAELHQRQAAGLRTYAGLEAYQPADPADEKTREPEISGKESERASEIIGNGIEKTAENDRLGPEAGSPIELGGRHGDTRVKDGTDLAGGIVNAVAKVAERLFDGFFGGGETVQKPPPATNSAGKPLPEHDAEKARRAAEEKAAAEARDAEIAALYASWEEARSRRRERGRDRD